MFCQLPRHVKPPPPAASGIDLHQVNDRPAETLHINNTYIGYLDMQVPFTRCQ